MSHIHLVIGPVGAGKSTFCHALALAQRAVHLDLDAWFGRLFSPDRPDDGVVPWYRERAARCVDQIWDVAERLGAVGADVILEIGLLQRPERQRFYRRVDASGRGLTIWVLDADRDERRARVERRNRERGATFVMVVPLPVFELASDLWEPPEPDECAGRDVRFQRTDLGV